MKKEYKEKFNIQQRNQINDHNTLQHIRMTQQLYRMRDDLGSINSAKNQQSSLDDSTKLLKRRGRNTKINTFCHNFINKNNLGLRKVLQQQKTKNIVNNFIVKLRRNITNSTPVQYQPFLKQEDSGILYLKGIRILPGIELFLSIFSIILIILLAFVYPLQILLQNTISNDGLIIIQTLSFVFYVTQILLGFITIKSIDDRKLLIIKDILADYLKRKFPLDFICIFCLGFDLAYSNQISKYLRIVVLIKLKQCLEKIQKVQNIFIKNFYKEQYWALAKIFFVNFAFAHLLATLLLAMSKLSDHNWLTKLNVSNSPWYQQYIWSFYWGTTIMLTVGFGDISPTNYKEALCITFIQTFTCILLAYNINCVGNLINNIRQQDIEKNKNFKIMKRLVQQNNITQDLQFRVCNYLDESDKMKKKFCFQAQKQFVSNLPCQLKADFLKQSNIKIFQNLRFFSNFSQKVLLTLAQKIEVKIAHPQQIIFKSQTDCNFIILRDGKVGYCTKKSGSNFNGTLIDLVEIAKQIKPIVLHLNFMFSNINQIKFQIKSLDYAMIYKISLDQFITILKTSSIDFQSFCELRDKSKHIIDQYQVIPCTNCPTKHSKMKCPKLHYIEINQKVLYKLFQRVKKGKNQRVQVTWQQQKPKRSGPLKLRKKFIKFEQQIYGCKTKKSTNKSKVSKQLSSQQNELTINQELKESTKGKLQVNDVINENIVGVQFQSKFLERIYQILDQRRQNTVEHFWDVQCDVVNNYKYYFIGQNSSQLNFTINSKLGGKQDQNPISQKFMIALKSMKNNIKV